MARNITSAFNTAITDSVVRPFVAVAMLLSGTTLRFWSGYGDITITAGGSSKTFTGLGDFISISNFEEASDLGANGVKISITGIKSSIIALALGAEYTNRNAYVYLGLFDTSQNVVADVYTLFSGKMDVMNISEDSSTGSVTIAVENRLVAFDMPRQRRYTLEDQKVDYSTDLGFEFVPDLQDKQLVWGKQTK